MKKLIKIYGTLFTLIFVGLFSPILTNAEIEAPTFGEAYEVAKWVEGLTGVRPAFLLSILQQESALGGNVGQCYLADTTSGASIHIGTGQSYSNGMHPTRDLPVFLTITEELEKDPFSMPIACPLSFGYGGAMGPAQIISSSWMLYKDRLDNLLGRVADPWSIRDSFLATGVFLADFGAESQIREDEWNAAMKYFSGGTTNSSFFWYADQVLARADQFEQDIKVLEENNGDYTWEEEEDIRDEMDDREQMPTERSASPLVIDGGPRHHVVALEPGWNIVSTPRVLESHEFSVEGTVENFDIYILDPTTPSGWNTMMGAGQEEFTPLYAYFINNKTGEAQTLRFDYDFGLEPNQQLFQRTLQPGWNAVGITLPEDILRNIRRSALLWIDFTGGLDSLKVADSWESSSNYGDIKTSSLKGYGVYLSSRTDDYIGYQNLTEFLVTEIRVSGKGGKDTVTKGQSMQMIAEVFPELVGDRSVTWSVENENIAEINEEGLLTGVEEGSVVVKATANDGSGVSGELEITVTPGPSLEMRRTTNSPEEGVAMVSTTGSTEVDLLEFSIKAVGGAVELEQLVVEVAGVEEFITEYIQDVFLTDGTEEFYATLDGNLATFDLENYEIKKDATKIFTAYVDVLEINIEDQGAVIWAVIAAEQEVGYDLFDEPVVTDRTITGFDQYLYVVAPELTLVSGSASWVNPNDTTKGANVVIEFKVTAVGGAVYIPFTTANVKVKDATPAHYTLGGFTTATGAMGIERVSGGTKETHAVNPGADYGALTELYKITEGNSAVFELFVGQTNLGSANRATVELLVWLFEKENGDLANDHFKPWTGNFVNFLRTNRL